MCGGGSNELAEGCIILEEAHLVCGDGGDSAEVVSVLGLFVIVGDN